MSRLRSFASARPLRVWGIALALVIAALTVVTSVAFAYNGEYCYGVRLAYTAKCTSNTVSNIRRAIGHAPNNFTTVEIGTNVGQKSGACYSNGCSADTGYLSRDGTGTGQIANVGNKTPATTPRERSTAGCIPRSANVVCEVLGRRALGGPAALLLGLEEPLS